MRRGDRFEDGDVGGLLHQVRTADGCMGDCTRVKKFNYRPAIREHSTRSSAWLSRGARWWWPRDSCRGVMCLPIADKPRTRISRVASFTTKDRCKRLVGIGKFLNRSAPCAIKLSQRLSNFEIMTDEGMQPDVSLDDHFIHPLMARAGELRRISLCWQGAQERDPRDPYALCSLSAVISV